MARKSRKKLLDNAGNIEQKASETSVKNKNACYKAGLYARLSEESEAKQGACNNRNADGFTAQVCSRQ